MAESYSMVILKKLSTNWYCFNPAFAWRENAKQPYSRRVENSVRYFCHSSPILLQCKSISGLECFSGIFSTFPSERLLRSCKT